jgi:putative Mg2+ transporter-C (MgtC) family protein
MLYDLESILRLMLASILGGVIGFEREMHGRAAGFRTHLLVSLGSCLFVITSIHFYELYGNTSTPGPPGVDPGRVAAQVVAGIGFLGAGAIIRDKASIRGLTTAACLWIAAAIGLACGAGLYFIAPLVTLFAVASLLSLKKIENWLTKDTYRSIRVWSEDIDDQTARIVTLLESFRLQPLNLTFEKDVKGKEIYLGFEIKVGKRDTAQKVLDSIAALQGVLRVRLD